MNLSATAAFDYLNSEVEAGSGRQSLDEVRALRFGLDGSVRDTLMPFAPAPAITVASLRIHRGVSWLGGSSGNEVPGPGRVESDFGFQKWSGEISRTQPVFTPGDGMLFSIAGLVAGQRSDDVLPLAEKYLFGGSRLGRGFYAGQVTGDSALGASVELQFDLRPAPFQIPGLDSELVEVQPGAQFYLFRDFGRDLGKPADRPGPHRRVLGRRRAAITDRLGATRHRGCATADPARRCRGRQCPPPRRDRRLLPPADPVLRPAMPLRRSLQRPDTRPTDMAQLHLAVSAVSPMRRLLLATTALLPVAMLDAGPALAQAPNAAPTGGQVVAGAASIRQAGSTTRIDQSSNRAAIDWRSFDVGRNQAVQFNQPSAAAWTLNRVNSPDPSLIAGRITANGGVAIVNQSGMVFAPGAQVNVGSLIASAANITNQNFMDGRMVFDGAPRPGARIENHGQITVADRGLASLVAPGVANTGVIQGRLARVALAGAETYALDLAGDGLLSIDVTQSVRRAPEGAVALVTNSGTIEAAGGSILLTADAARGVIDTMVRNTGRISADAAGGTRAGQVAIRGQGGDVRIDAGSVSATGTAAAGVSGGSVSVASPGGAVAVAAGARVDATGAAGGGQVQLGGATTRAVTVAGQATARGTGGSARGGQVAAQARDQVAISGSLDASGGAGGGTVLAGTTGVGRNQLMAGEVRLSAGSELRADATLRGHGGTIAVNSTTRTEALGTLSARGGPVGGNGGFIEVSGKHSLTLAGDVRLDAPAGAGGTLLIDPTTINIVDAGDADGSVGAGTISFADDPNGNGIINISAAELNTFTAGVNVLLQADSGINVNFAVDRTTAGNISLQTLGTGTIAVNESFSVRGGSIGFETGTLTISAPIGASVGITMNATVISQTGIITTPVLTATGGSIGLGGANVVDSFSGTASGALTFNSLNDLVVAGASGSVVALSAASLNLAGAVGGSTSVGLTATAGGITQTAAVTTPVLTATATGGSIALGGANVVDSFGGTAGGTLALNSVHELTVTGVSGTAVALSAGSLNLTGAVGGSTSVGLTATAGGITQTAAVTTPVLTATATGGSIALGGANGVDSFGGTAGGALALNSTNDLTVSGASGTVVALSAGSLNLTGGVDGSTSVGLTATAGGIMQTAAITTPVLTAAATGGSIALAGANVVQSFGGTASGALAFTSTNDLTVSVAGGTAVTLSAASLNLTGAVGGSTGVGLTATAGGITQTVAITTPVLTATATGGSIALGGANVVDSFGGTAGGALALNSTNDLTVSGASGTVVALSADSLNLTGTVGGSTSAGLTATAGGITQTAAVTTPVLTATATDGSIALSSANVVDSFGGTAGGALALNSTSDLVVGGVSGTVVALRAGSLNLTGAVGGSTSVGLTATNGGIAQTAAVTTPVLTATATGGSIALGGANMVDSFGGSASGALTFNSTKDLVVSGVSGTVVALSADSLNLTGTVGGSTSVGLTATNGGIAQTAAVTTPVLTATATGGSIALSSANVVDSFGGTASGALTFTSVNDLAVTGASGTVVALSAGSLNLTGAVSGSTSVGLTATAGGIAQTAAVTTPVLTATATGGSIALSSANVVDSFGGTASGALALNSTNDLTVSGASGTAVTLSADSLNLTGTVGGSTSVGLTATNGGIAQTAVVTTPVLTATATAPTRSNGSIVLERDNVVDSFGGMASGVLTFNSVNNLTVIGASGTAIAIGAPDITIQGPIRAVADASLAARNGDIVLGAEIASGSGTTLTAAGRISQTEAGRLVAPLLAATASRSIELDQAGNVVDRISGMTAGDGDLLLRLAGRPTQIAGALSATGSLVVTAEKALEIDLPSGSRLAAASGNMRITTGEALTLDDSTVFAAGALALGAATRVDLNRTELRADTIAVTAGNGNLTATGVRASAGGDLTFMITGGGRALRLIGGDYRGEHVVVAAGPAGDGSSTIAFSNTSFTVGTALLFAAGNGIGEAGDLISIIRASGTAARPLVIFDTRRSSGALRDLDPSVFTAATRDNPGLEAGAQPWQVASERLLARPGGRTFGTAIPGGDGSPAATSAAAGDVRLNLDAQLNPVFMLIDGGSIRGQLDAGRLGVHGLPTSGRLNGDPVAELTGALSGFGGTTAARFGLVTATPSSGQALYRINDCVISTLNCVATSIVQPLLIPLVTNFSLRGVQPSLDQDVLVPNVAEEDY
jgi:filamentous hemagglutinin family protein